MPWRAISLDEREAANHERCGPKAANLALMRQAGLPTPSGFVVEADVYHRQLASLGLASAAASVGSDDGRLARRAATQIKLALLEGALLPEIEDGLLHARQQIIMTSTLLAVRSSALVEDRAARALPVNSTVTSESQVSAISSRQCARAGRRYGRHAFCVTWRLMA